MSTILSNATEVALPTGTWKVDPVHSRVEFAVRYMTGTFRGTFSPVEATLDVAEDGAATLAGSAQAADVRVQDENLTGHLQASDFFDAERTPGLAFRSERIGRGGDTVTVDGELTIKGQTQPVRLAGTISDPIPDPQGNHRIGLALQGTVDRTAFGLDWNLPLPSGEPALANDVDLFADLFLVRS
jgi:polyisoprenoid-binding protein YceI